MDQIPVYTVEEPGSQKLIYQLNPGYYLPSQNHFMYTDIPELYNSIKPTTM